MPLMQDTAGKGRKGELTAMMGIVKSLCKGDIKQNVMKNIDPVVLLSKRRCPPASEPHNISLQD